jgi:hypothetical protein
MDTASTALLFTPEIEELTRAMERHLSPPATSARFFMVLGAIVISVGMSALGVESRINDVIVGGAIMFGLLLIFAHSRWAKRRTLRGMLRRSPALTAHREVIATPDGLRLITATSDLRFAWSYYQSAVTMGWG